MPTFNTPNSTSTYTVPAGVVALDVDVRGGSGGDADAAGGAGGEASVRYPVEPGDEITVYVGESGGQPTGGQSPVDGGVSGGDGGQSGGSYQAEAGGGGAPSAIVGTGGTLIAVGGGGGGGGGDFRLSGSVSQGGGGGGGGARGGLGGAGGSGDDPGEDGQDGDGSGVGGDGGDGEGFGDPSPGEDGGTITTAAVTTLSTGTASSAEVVITDRYPPAVPQDLSIDAVRDTELDVSWTDPDGVPNTEPEDGYRIYTIRLGEGQPTETLQADLAADTTSTTITGLLTGERYYVYVEAYTDAAARGDVTTDIAPGTTDAVAAGDRTLDWGQHGIGGTHEIAGGHDTKHP